MFLGLTYMYTAQGLRGLIGTLRPGLLTSHHGALLIANGCTGEDLPIKLYYIFLILDFFTQSMIWQVSEIEGLISPKERKFQKLFNKVMLYINGKLMSSRFHIGQSQR